MRIYIFYLSSLLKMEHNKENYHSGKNGSVCQIEDTMTDNCAGIIQKGINCFVCIEVEANNNIGM